MAKMTKQQARVVEELPYQRRVERLWDRRVQRFKVELLPGQRWTACESELLTAVIGAGCCLAIRHRESKVAAMASLLIAPDTDALWAIEYCLSVLEELSHRVLERSDDDRLSELEVWGVIGGDVGSLGRRDRDFQLSVLSGLLMEFGANIMEMHHGGTVPLSVCFDPVPPHLAIHEIAEPPLVSLRRDLECIARLQLEHQRRLVDEFLDFELDCPEWGERDRPLAAHR